MATLHFLPIDSWIPDKEATKCGCCSAKFRLFRRRHHCRSCGRVFCRHCTSSKIALQGACGRVRVCTFCINKASTIKKKTLDVSTQVLAAAPPPSTSIAQVKAQDEKTSSTVECWVAILIAMFSWLCMVLGRAIPVTEVEAPDVEKLVPAVALARKYLGPASLGNSWSSYANVEGAAVHTDFDVSENTILCHAELDTDIPAEIILGVLANGSLRQQYDPLVKNVKTLKEFSPPQELKKIGDFGVQQVQVIKALRTQCNVGLGLEDTCMLEGIFSIGTCPRAARTEVIPQTLIVACSSEHEIAAQRSSSSQFKCNAFQVESLDEGHSKIKMISILRPCGSAKLSETTSLLAQRASILHRIVECSRQNHL